jgi:hypothetical protein
MRYSRFLINSPLLFIAESQYSPYCLIRRVATLRFIITGSLIVRIICINSRLSFNTESRYSPYCLLQRVLTPWIVNSGESLLTAESYFKKLWRTPPSFKGTMKQKMDTCRALLTKNILKDSKIWVAYGWIFGSPLSVTAGSQYFDILSKNNSTKIWQNSKSLLGRSIEARTSRLVKKTGVKKSCWIVPLKWESHQMIYFNLES